MQNLVLTVSPHGNNQGFQSRARGITGWRVDSDGQFVISPVAGYIYSSKGEFSVYFGY